MILVVKLGIVGNGVDLALKLGTSLKKDFPRFVSEYDKVEFLTDLYFNNNKNLWGEFETRVGIIGEEFARIIGFESKSEKEILHSIGREQSFLEKEIEDQGYGELEIENVAVDHVRANFSLENINEVTKINEANEIIDLALSEMVTEANKKIEAYSYKNIDEILECDWFINFNYTYTLEELNVPKNRILYLHGNLEEDLIWGNTVDNVMDKNNWELMGDDYLTSRAYKYFREKHIENTAKKLQIEKMDTFLEKINNEIDEIYVLGHSVSEPDIEYFRDLDASFPEAKWFVYNTDETVCDNLKTIGINSEYRGKLSVDVKQ